MLANETQRLNWQLLPQLKRMVNSDDWARLNLMIEDSIMGRRKGLIYKPAEVKAKEKAQEAAGIQPYRPPVKPIPGAAHSGAFAPTSRTLTQSRTQADITPRIMRTPPRMR